LKEFYYELKITPNFHYELYLDLLLSINDGALEELENSIIVRSETSLDDVIVGIEMYTEQLQKVLDTNVSCEILLEEKSNEDWIKKYQDSIEAIEVDKFFIHPSWIQARSDKTNIVINPALAFGSGHHETTSTCLKAISQYVNKNDSLIDVGTGSGILAIGASKLGASCDICDTDPVSIDNSKENFELNNTSFNKAWVGSALKANKTYDIVVANIVADVLTIIKNDLKKILKDDGILIISGILDKYEDKIVNKYKEFKIKEKIQKNEWITFVLTKDNNEQ
jgi:ribosomal protein L11 methyltransferase